MEKHEPTAWIEGNEILVGWAAPKPIQTQYIKIIHHALWQLHLAYPHQRIELRIKEAEVNGWQCYIEFTENDVKLGSESFYINPPIELSGRR